MVWVKRWATDSRAEIDGAGMVDLRVTLWVPVISVTSCDLRILMDQPTESISS